jgi:hypothetical protein
MKRALFNVLTLYSRLFHIYKVSKLIFQLLTHDQVPLYFNELRSIS